MLKKILSLGIAIYMSVIMVLSPPWSVSAKAKTDNPNMQAIDMVESDKMADAIKLIEQKYLVRNKDGTFSMKKNADKHIDSETLESITTGMNQINQMIKNGDLVSQEDLTVKQTSQYKGAFSNNKGSIMTMTTVADLGNVVWHWYGFDVWCNSGQSAIMAKILRACAADIKYASGAGAVVGYAASGVYGLTIALGTGFSVYNFTKGAEQCQLGAESGNGSVVYFLGKPTWAIFTHARSIVYV